MPDDVRAPAAGRRFDAFISYSRALDGRLASLLQGALQRFAKPWYRLRVLRVFRDDASLSANPALWSSIADAIAASEFFVLLASPAAAESKWVGREVAHWLEERDPRRLLIVLTEGELFWDESGGDFDRARTDVLPQAMYGAFAAEPRYVDLRWARRADDLSLRNPRFREAIADLAAPLHGRSKDDLIGEEVVQHRRAMRLARGGVTALVLLAAAALTAAVLAVQSRNRANTEAKVATSRQLAVQAAASLRDGQLDLGLLLAAQAYDTTKTPEARSVLAEALAASGHLQRLVKETPLDLAAASPDGTVLALARRGGPVVVRDVANGLVVDTLSLPARPTSIAVSSGGGKLAIAVLGSRLLGDQGADSVRALSAWVDLWDVRRNRWDPAFGGRKYPGVGSEFASVAATPDAGVVAWSSGRPGVSEIGVWSGGSTSTLHPSSFPCQVLVNADGSLLASIGLGLRGTQQLTEISVWRLPRSGPPVERPQTVFLGRSGVAPAETGGCAPDGSAAFSPSRPEVLAVGGWNGTVTLWDASTGGRLGQPLQGKLGVVSQVAFSPDGRQLLARDAGGISMWSIDSGAPLAGGLAESASDLGVWFVDSRTVAAVGSAGTIALSDLRGRAFQLGAVVPTGVGVRHAAFHPGGSSLAVADEGGTIRFLDTSSWRPRGEPIATRFDFPTFAFSTDGRRLVAQGTVTGGQVRQLWDVERRRPLGDSLVGELGLVSFASDGSAVVIETGLRDSTLRELGGAGLPVRLAGTRDTQAVHIHARDGRALVETLWGDGVWDIRTGRRVSRLLPSGVAAWTDDGTTIATGGDRIELWDASSGRRIATLDGDVGPRAMRFSADGSLLAVAGNGLEVWDVPRGRRLGGRRLADVALTSLEFAPDGLSVATLDDQNDVLIWNLDPSGWASLACRLAERRLTAGEWLQLLGTRAYAPAC